MTTLGARQRLQDSRWAYVSMRAEEIYPVGYCAGTFATQWPETRDPRWDMWTDATYAAARTLVLPFAHLFHSDGHAMKNEACACYRQFLLNHRLRFVPDHPNPKTIHRCAIDGCAQFTSGSAIIEPRHWPLCVIHRYPDTFAEHCFPPGSVGESFTC